MKDRSAVDSYVEAAGVREGGRYVLRPEELLWLLTSGERRDSADLDLLKALQRSLPRSEGETAGDGTVEELKGVLTNAIIMRSRLGEREGGLAALLERAIGDGVLGPVEVDETVVRRLAEMMAEAGERLHPDAGT